MKRLLLLTFFIALIALSAYCQKLDRTLLDGRWGVKGMALAGVTINIDSSTQSIVHAILEDKRANGIKEVSEVKKSQ